MRYTLFGRTGLRVSELSLGAMTFGVPSRQSAEVDGCRRLLDAYTELGGNFVDTANGYAGGASESIIGELLEGRRDQFVLATKYTTATREGDVNSAGNHRKTCVSRWRPVSDDCAPTTSTSSGYTPATTSPRSRR